MSVVMVVELAVCGVGRGNGPCYFIGKADVIQSNYFALVSSVQRAGRECDGQV